VPGTAHFLLGRTFRRLHAAVAGELKKARAEATAFLLPPPPGPVPGTAPKGLGTARFTKPLESERRKAWGGGVAYYGISLHLLELV
jgi:hypothetical protein